jgi:hypothetical protein
VHSADATQYTIRKPLPLTSRKEAKSRQADVGRNYIYDLESGVYFDAYNYGHITRFFNGSTASRANVVAEREPLAFASY